MTTIQLCILAYSGINASIILWFFIIRPAQIDKEYNEKLKKIYDSTKM